MIAIRRSDERGRTRAGWLDGRHSFSFGDYHDPTNMGFSNLRVINDDRVAPGGGFPTHPHRDMEIVTYVLSGRLQHRDSMGNGSVIGAGDVQRMTAGRGVQHSEFNPSDAEPVRLLQIWIRPLAKGLEPEYGQQSFDRSAKLGKLATVASRDGRDGSMKLNADADIFAAVLPAGSQVVHTPAPGRSVWVQAAAGSAIVNGRRLDEGDGAAITGEPSIELKGAGTGDAELLVFDLPQP